SPESSSSQPILAASTSASVKATSSSSTAAKPSARQSWWIRSAGTSASAATWSRLYLRPPPSSTCSMLGVSWSASMPGSGGVDDEDVDVGLARDLRRDRAEDPPGQRAEPPVAHHDEVGGSLLRRPQQRADRFPLDGEGVDVPGAGLHRAIAGG